MNDEIWKVIENFLDYEVSNMGRVKSLKFGKEKILTPGKNKFGYLYVILSKNKKPYNKKVHRLVLENFDPRENSDDLQCNHINGIKDKNIYPDNIEWCTCSENIKHAYKNRLMTSMKGENNSMFGKHPSEKTRKLMREKKKGKHLGEGNPNSILTEKKVIEIRIDLKEGILTQKEIGEKFGVKKITISNINTGRTWKHIGESI